MAAEKGRNIEILKYSVRRWLAAQGKVGALHEQAANRKKTWIQKAATQSHALKWTLSLRQR